LLAVVVTDNGVPHLSATQFFTVTVLAPPRMQGIQVAPGELSLMWDTMPGQLYQLEYTEDLSYPAWTALGLPIQGTGEPLEAFQEILPAGQRFYRVRLMP
jgi:hypothetical protein